MLYLGAGSPLTPMTGMDIVVRAHLEELLAAPALHVSGVVVAPAGAAEGQIGPVAVISGDAVGSVPRARRLWCKLHHAAVGRAPMMAYGFRSSQARSFIRRALSAEAHDVVVIDHINTLANVSPRNLQLGDSPIIYLAHDVTPAQVRAIAHLKPHWRRALLAIDAAKAAWTERMLVRQVQAAAFLSEADRCHYGSAIRQSISLLPLLQAPKPLRAPREPDASLLFVGGTGFLPNAAAIDWLASRFAAALARAAPTLQIVLAGGGTERLSLPHNVKGLGFVPEEALHQLIASCLGVLCPVIHGSGIKIKLLEALAHGCPVFATEPALRGLDAFGIAPALHLADPEASVSCVLDVVGDPIALSAERRRLAMAWQEHVRTRQGALATLVRRTATAGR